MKPTRLLNIMLLALWSIAINSGEAGAYSFTKIADNQTGYIGSNYSSFGRGFSTPWSHTNWNWSATSDPNSPHQGLAINNQGQVAFFANLKNPNGGQGIFINSNGTNKTVATNLDKFSQFGQGLSLNDNGEVAFFADLSSTDVGNILIGNSTTTNYRKIADTEGVFSSFAPGLSLNDNGEVAFLASLGQDEGEIFKSDGTNVTQITDCSGSGITGSECPIQSQRPSINDSGEVAFTSKNGVFSSADGQTTKNIMSDPASFANGRYHDASINNLGRVIYRTGLNTWANSAAILSSTDRRTSIISGNTPPFHSVSRSPAINNDGEVAFVAEKGYNYGIYTGHSLQDRVIGVGDSLFGAKVTDIFIDRESLNDNCQIAFWASLDSGMEGIFRADPGVGECQNNPLMPDVIHEPGKDGLVYSFINTPGRAWYDPPSAYGFRYEMTGDSLFTEILNLPSGFENPLTVSVEDTVLGEFVPGDKVDFVSRLGRGVKEFSVTGISVDFSDPTAFPIKLNFDSSRASFNMYALTREAPESDRKKVPEPGSVWALLALGIAGAGSAFHRHRKMALSS